MTSIVMKDTVPGLPPFAVRVLERWLKGLTSGRIIVDLPGNHRLTFGSAGAEAHIIIHDARALWRVAASGSVGWAESYMAGEWDTPDLTGFLTLAARNLDALGRDGGGTWIARAFHRINHLLRANTRAGSRRNIAAHYDLGNAFYQRWLDPSMTYSSAIFDNKTEDFTAAQTRKYRRLCDLLQVKPGDHILEVGCGWGGFAEIAARDYGCRVTALTLSKEQADYARQRMQRHGLSGQVDVRLQDYRDVKERFDAIASIEMFEAVGLANWPTYFNALRERLAPGGRAAVQTITISSDKFERYKRNADFIQRYIFPGGMLPSRHAFGEEAARAGFKIEDSHFFGADYAETLRRWGLKFNAEWPAIASLGFDERFRRMWNYYLSYCQAGFLTQHIDVAQFLMTRDGGPAISAVAADGRQ